MTSWDLYTSLMTFFYDFVGVDVSNGLELITFDGGSFTTYLPSYVALALCCLVLFGLVLIVYYLIRGLMRSIGGVGK